MFGPCIFAIFLPSLYQFCNTCIAIAVSLIRRARISAYGPFARDGERSSNAKPTSASERSRDVGGAVDLSDSARTVAAPPLRFQIHGFEVSFCFTIISDLWNPNYRKASFKTDSSNFIKSKYFSLEKCDLNWFRTVRFPGSYSKIKKKISQSSLPFFVTMSRKDFLV